MDTSVLIPQQLISERIEIAMEHECQTKTLFNSLKDKLPHLHSSIRINETDPLGCLYRFICDYIHLVPQFIAGMEAIANNVGIGDTLGRALDIAAGFILITDSTSEAKGLEDLLPRAYLCHRLLEEINDQFIGLCGLPITPIDMTCSNLIVHNLLGENFANELDSAVFFSLNGLLPSITQLNDEQAESMRSMLSEQHERSSSHWPCFARDLSLELQLGKKPMRPSGSLH